ncbi:site-specific DNA-methyltransferase [Paenibacillus lactis]|uniref:Adenine-specific DNA-methyltransferase n=1 Tax=Paenibacillus lactis TaxID=228574 RepID=A0ABS4FKV6_9BACL|nr:site-specific DNA-methyltransferase [Paenibacillus lactis]MBP1896891.1 adenine-specific DNA-methyltransferase [Paenibacillus lactis]
MNKLTMKSTDLTQVNIDKIAELFPNVITEARDEQGKIKRAVDFDLLRQELSDVLVEGEKERYQLTWPGKKEAIFNANTVIEKTLRPVKNSSVDWDNTKNIYIEGDNLEVLKILQESYLNKVKCIYIDPPYNTGNDFIYNDDFRESEEEYFEESGQVDAEGNKLVHNTTSNGRFHSDWLTMIYSRLKIARNLLRDDGLIFISIDENEIENLKKVCNEIFGEPNFVAQLVWQKKTGAGAKSKGFIGLHEYILCYARNISPTWDLVAPLSEKTKAMYNKKDEHYEKLGPYATWPLDTTSMDDRANLRFPIYHNGHEIWPRKQWLWSRERVEVAQKENKLVFNYNEKEGSWSVRFKGYLFDETGEVKAGKPTTLFIGPYTQEGTKDFEKHFPRSLFPFPKPVELIKQLLQITVCSDSHTDDIILDFFSGSGTTAEAVMQLNGEDRGSRKYIMVQTNEERCSEDSDAYKAGFENICEIGKERIRRAAKKIKEETGAEIDYGFRVYRVDSSNMKDVYYTPDRLGQMNLDDVASNIKEDRNGEDLLIQVMLECGLELSLPMESREIDGKTVHYVAGNSLIACFDDEVSESVIKKIAEDKPLRVVFRDSSFRDDSARINVEELFKLLSPSTEIQVL